MRVAVITISDRSARGEREDISGGVLQEIVRAQGWEVALYEVISDDQPGITARLKEICDQQSADLVLTTGGTGFAPRDMAPEATLAVVERQAPGLAEAMRAVSLRKTPHAMLSRAVAGIRRRTLIINLPGSPRAAEENLRVVLPALAHAVELLQDSPRGEEGHRWNAPNPQI